VGGGELWGAGEYLEKETVVGRAYKILIIVLIIGLLASTGFSVVEVIRLKGEVDHLMLKVDIGGYCSQVPNYPNMFYFTADEPTSPHGVWFVVSPNGVPCEEGKFCNFAGFEIWRQDASDPDSFGNLEWLEIGAGSPCYMTDDFLISTNKFGNGTCRDLVFGTMRTDTGDHQVAFRVVTTDGEDIYALFEKDLRVDADLILAGQSSLGLFGVTPSGQQSHIEDAEATPEDLAEKFNALLDALEAYGLLEE
jgi:hypothetical protein